MEYCVRMCVSTCQHMSAYVSIRLTTRDLVVLWNTVCVCVCVCVCARARVRVCVCARAREQNVVIQV
jgi:hypothetical protein